MRILTRQKQQSKKREEKMEATSALKPQRDLTTKIKAVIFDCGGVLAGALMPVAAPMDLKRLP